MLWEYIKKLKGNSEINKVRIRHVKPLYSGFQTTPLVRASSPKSWSFGCFAPAHPQDVLILGFSSEGKYLSVYGCLGTILYLLQLSRSGKEARLEQGCDMASLNDAFASTNNVAQRTTVLSLFQVVSRAKHSPTALALWSCKRSV